MFCSSCLAVTMRLVPTSSPTAGLFGVSVFISVLLVRALMPERRDFVSIFPLQESPVFRHCHVASRRLVAQPQFGQGEALPDPRTGRIDIYSIVFEAQQVEAG